MNFATLKIQLRRKQWNVYVMCCITPLTARYGVLTYRHGLLHCLSCWMGNAKA